jgi:ATP-dependent DNA ligase
MLSRAATLLPSGDGWQFEPKWDGFRALVFRNDAQVVIQSRDEKPLNRYFPELLAPLAGTLPPSSVLDGELIVVGTDGLDFEALLQRIHPAASRVALLSEECPASYVAWDLLAVDGEDLRQASLAERRPRLERLLRTAAPPVHLSPATLDRRVAQDWFRRFEGAGLDGVMAKRLDEPYRPGERTMIKVKHVRTADCVVAGFRWHATGKKTMVGSLLLGLFDEAGVLHHVGVTSAFTHAVRRELVAQLAPLRKRAREGHPWLDSGANQRVPGGASRWNSGKDLRWEPLRPQLVCEVAYDHMQGQRFRHAARFVRWRPDKRPRDCGYDQLAVTPPYELQRVFGA